MTDLHKTREKRRPTWLTAAIVVVAGLIVVVGLTAANYRFAAASPGGNDFIPRWLGARLLLQQGQNPYSDETSLAIQRFIYGRPAEADEDQVLFVYPLYALPLFAPFAAIGDYLLARAVWMTTLEVGLLALAFISLRLASWRPALPVVALLLIFVLTWYHGARPLINGNPSILMALFVAGGLLAMQNRRDILAGPLLALATIKPQAVVLVLPLILIWAVIKRRFELVASILISMAVLIGFAALIEPAWIIQNIEQVTAYPDYTLAGTPGDIFRQWWPTLGPWPGLILSIIVLMLLIWQWRLAISGPFQTLVVAVFFTLASTNLIGITTAVSNYIALFPGLILLLAFLRRNSSSLPDWPAAIVLMLLLVGLWALFWFTRSGNAQSPIMFFPLPLLLLLALPLVARTSRQADPGNRPNEFLST